MNSSGHVQSSESAGFFLRLLSLLLVVVSPLAGCGGPEPAAPAGATGGETGRPRVRVGYLGLTCEAAMFVAQENGFFGEEGLDIEFVKTDWDSLRDGLGLGRFDANYHLIMYLLKPIEKGLDVKLTGGIHSGCLRLQAGAKTNIRTVQDLKGKRIGVQTALGSPPFLFSSRVLKAAGMDPAKDVEWVPMAGDVLGLALDNGQVDAVCNSEPIGSIMLSQGNVRTIADQAADAPYSEEYCCAVVVSGKLAREDPATAAKLTRALLKGARWVEQNPSAAARLSVEKKYIAASVEINSRAISNLKYAPGVDRCRESVLMAAKEMKAIGLLDAVTDPEELARRAWLDLDGVTDEWVSGLRVESIAGGGPVPETDPIASSPVSLARALREVKTCCDRKP